MPAAGTTPASLLHAPRTPPRCRSCTAPCGFPGALIRSQAHPAGPHIDMAGLPRCGCAAACAVRFGRSHSSLALVPSAESSRARARRPRRWAPVPNLSTAAPCACAYLFVTWPVLTASFQQILYWPSDVAPAANSVRAKPRGRARDSLAPPAACALCIWCAYEVRTWACGEPFTAQRRIVAGPRPVA